jgi:hypothetical protein
VFVPVSSISGTTSSSSSDSSKLRYIGGRLRLNVTGISSGSAVWNRARELVQAWISRGGRNAQKVQQVLAQAPDMQGCANALLGGEAPGAITAACGAPVSLEVDLQEAAQLREQLAGVRRAADARYFGADVRFDHGDPTLGAVPNAAGNSLYAGLAFGRSLSALAGSGGSVGFRSRVGVRQARLDASDTTEFAVEGGFGFDLSRSLDTQQIDASAGIEFRRGNAPASLDQRLQTNYAVVRGSLLIPITQGNSLSLSFGTPIAGDISPSLSVNFNWGLLLPDRIQR